MYTTLKSLGKCGIQTNLSKFDERLFSDKYLCRLCLTQGREIQDLNVSRQGVPERCSSEGYASFKQVKPWPWHVEVIPGVGLVGLVTNKELCQVIWGLLLRTLCINTPLLQVSCCGRFKIPSALIFCSVDRDEGSGRINLLALRCREFSFF